MVLLDPPQLGLDVGQFRVQLVLQSGLVLDPTGAVLTQEVNLHLDSEGSLRRKEISDNTSGVRDTLPASPTTLGIVDQSKFTAVGENFAL